MNLQNSKIYAVKSHNSDLVYIGSTTVGLKQRLASHVSSYKNFIENKGAHYMSANKILECEDYYIELIKDFPCETKKTLLIEEGKEMLKFEAENPDKLVNRCIAGLTVKEQHKRSYERHKEKRLESCKKYREEHKEEYAISHRNYYEKNKDRLSELNKVWANNNREKVREMQKRCREKKKDDPAYKEKIRKASENYRNLHPEIVRAQNERSKEKVICECGMTVTRSSLKRHQKRAICKKQ